MTTHLTFRFTETNLAEIERIRNAYSSPGNLLSVADAIRVALCVTCRQLDSERVPSSAYAGDMVRSDPVADSAESVVESS